MKAGLLALSLAFALPSVALAASQQPAAVLTPVTVIGEGRSAAAEDRVAETPADLFSDLTPIASRRLASGVTVRVWRYTVRQGTCEAGREAATCPGEALLVSTTPDQSGEAEFGLWTSSARLGWTRSNSESPGGAKADDGAEIRLETCEASVEVASGQAHPRIGDDWREVAYGLSVGRTGAVSFVRLAEDAPQRGCFHR
ncbi:MAG TPA: hypothetical protein VII73_00010 [Caulobacteraceae bacterium]